MKFKTFPQGLNGGAVLIFVLQMLVAAIAELCLGSFPSPEEPAARVSRAIGILLTLFVLHIVAKLSLTGYRTRNAKSHVWLYLLLALSMVLVSVVKVLGLALIHYSDKGHATIISGESLAFFLPVTAAVLLIQSVLGLHFGLMSSLFGAVLLGMYLPMPEISFCLVLTTSLVACTSFMQVRSRAAYLKAALNIALIAAPFAIISIVQYPPLGIVDASARILGCLVGGCLSAFLVVGITPVVEYLGGYASDMRLIEMATLDHPLLKELSVQAPGTWNHSMVIGMMVESAADAIGANPVVCRVGAYFHDIGKMKKPLYFVENQDPGDNRHDKLSPSMSALIIRSHVKDGVELARKHKLPRVIEDLIPQHHGTSTIEYFYEKARKEAEDLGKDVDTVDRSLYSYPGPRPQTREAGLLMLADGIEAAARTLSDPSFDRIQGMVQKMINKVFSSGELNECELTLRDLHLIAKCFTRVLSGIYHQRIAYAEPAEKVNEAASEEAENPNRRDRRVENLKRLGVE
jgi:putative nucleotidyltransferase with HDIG domain